MIFLILNDINILIINLCILAVFYFLLSVFMSCRLALKYLPNLAVTVKYFQTSCAKYSAAAAAYDRKHL